MKKIWFLFLAVSLSLLWGCGSRRVLGQIVNADIHGETGMDFFVIQTAENEQIGIEITEDTYVFSFVDGFSPEDFLSGQQTEVSVSVTYDGLSRKQTMGDGEKLRVYQGDQIEVVGILQPDACVLKDGIHVDVWAYTNGTSYVLPSGVELLWVQNPMGPNHVSVGGTEGFDDLTEAAQTGILGFYRKQGLLYDVQTELEKAYEAYCQGQEDAAFQSRSLRQDVSPTAYNSTLIYFLTSVGIPTDGSHNQEIRLGAAFDKETGEHLENWELLSCPPEEAQTRLLDLAGITDPVLRKEMEQAFSWDNIIFFSDHLEICFQEGVLPSQKYGSILALDYDPPLLELLHPWAVPAERE